MVEGAAVLMMPVAILAVLLCFAGLGLSCFSFSGMWLVLLATLLLWALPDYNVPTLGMLLVFLALCVAAEIAEALAGLWGVRRRGGSSAAGWAALGGGLIGMLLGSFLIPVPLFGVSSIAGLLIGSYAAAFAVEYRRLRRRDAAAHIALGAVVARVTVLLIKLLLTLGMIIALVFELLSA